MAEVILIQPHVGNWDTVRSHPSIPLALLYVASLVEKEYSVKIIDQRTDEKWEDTLRKELNANPLCVGITSITGRQILHALDAAEVVKKESEVPVVLGGIHASLLPKQSLENENIDFIVQGEGEITFFELASALADEKNIDDVKGIWYKKSGQIKATPPRPFVDLNTLPEPLPYHLLDLRSYLPTFKDRRTMYIQTSRGCPYRCVFCYNTIYNQRKWRSLTSERTLQQIKTLYDDFNISSFYIVDDNFFVNLRRAEEIARGILENRWDILWESQGIRINQVAKMDNHYLSLLDKSGCKKLHFGVESGSPRILELIKKDISVEQVLDVNRKLKDFDFTIQYNFMAGFPTETLSDIEQTIALIFRLNKENNHAGTSPVCIYTPYVGTELFDLAVKNGLKIPDTLEGWGNFSQDNVIAPWLSKEMKDLLKSLYLTSMFYDKKGNDMVGSRVIKFLSNLYRPIARYRMQNLFFKFMLEKNIYKIFVS